MCSTYRERELPQPHLKICLLPVIEEGGKEPPTRVLHSYLEAFYDCEIKLLEPVFLTNQVRPYAYGEQTADE